ncbi:unnamed protein product [Cladocopium goreaui]|uniref:Insulysin n=1 Tax=Cladocopium goreaui TaxID=2562237 RepID=A0A9P1GGR3_9DINO|nr:unnamed protein product [Cladocopium goreaui]
MAHWGLLWPRARRAALATAARPDADPLGRWLACGLATVAVAHRAKGGSKAEIREIREIRAPETHRRNYEFVRLENGMQVILASDANCDRAACALCVGVGKMHEPKDMPGLAHFCEHMLFLGTEAFPEEAEYKRFVKRHGGKCNAFTSDSKTCYVFDVAPAHLSGALDRFCQFFRTPLFSESATEREINAVDSEHSMNIQADSRRSYAALLLDANPRHPLHWGSGNAQSLREEPKKRGVKLHSEVVKFYKENYTSEDMTLAIVGKEPLDELRQMVFERFRAVTSTGRTALRGDEHGGSELPFRPQDFVGACWRVPSKDYRQVTFSWQLPQWQVPFWKSKPSNYASHILGHEGPGSLLSALKAAGWATALSAGEADFGTFSQFQVSISLTDQGLEQVEEIGRRLFTTIALLRSSPVSDWMLQELRQLKEVKFRFADDQQPYGLVVRLAENLQKYPAEEVLSGPILLPEPDPVKVVDYLQHLTVDQVRVELVSKKFEDRCTKKDPWYGGKYYRAPLEASWLEAWRRVEIPGSANVKAQEFGLRLPKPNVFVPQDISVSPPGIPGSPWPERLAATGRSYQIFHRKDDRFLQPKTLVAFNVHCPRTFQDALRHLLTTIWCSCIEEELNEFAYDASQAGLAYSLDSSVTGMSLMVAGFSDKLPVLLEAVVSRMGKAVSSSSFDIVLDRYQRHLRNVALKQRPCDLALRKSTELTRQNHFSTEEMLAVIDQVRLEDVQSEHQRLFRDAFFETLVTGHAGTAEAEQLAEHLAPLVPGGRAPEDPEEAEFPEGQTLWIIPGTNPEERNNCVLMELQLPGNLQGSVFTALLVRMLNPKVFEDLRTKQQLGYIVQLSNMEGRRFQKLRLLVQTEFEAPEVRARIERCWKRQLQWVLEEMDEAEFQRQKQGLGSLLAEAPKNLNEEFNRFWVEVTRRRYDFQRRQKKLELLRAAELQAFRDFVAQLDAAPRLFIEIHSLQRSKELGEALTPSAVDRVWNGMEALQSFRSTANWRATERIAAKL